jgi:hypothetical protein
VVPDHHPLQPSGSGTSLYQRRLVPDSRASGRSGCPPDSVGNTGHACSFGHMVLQLANKSNCAFNCTSAPLQRITGPTDATAANLGTPSSISLSPAIVVF